MSTTTATPASDAVQVATPATAPAATAPASTLTSALTSTRTTVSVTLSPEAHAFFTAAAKAEHRSLPNYLFVQLEQVYQHGHHQQQAQQQILNAK